MKKKEKFLSTVLAINEAGDLIVTSPNSPDKRPDFVELIKRELGLLLQKGSISHKLHAYSVEICTNMRGILTGIYAGRPHGLDQALQVVLKLARVRM